MTLFNPSTVTINSLLEQIDSGSLGLPEMQRPFVWSNVKVRNLLDSIYQGYPAGFLLFWNTGVTAGLKSIGGPNTASVPQLAIVDGQQRLTALYAVHRR